MATTAQQWQQMILDQIGAELPDVRDAIDIVKENIGLFWDMWAAKADQPYLQYLYTRRTAFDAIIGQFRNKTSANLGVLNPQLGQKVDRMVGIMRQNFSEEILYWEKVLRASRPGKVAQITAVTPRTVPAGQADPSDVAYRGDPIFRTFTGSPHE